VIRKEEKLQRSYYAATAAQYDRWHLCESDEHFFALAVLVGLFDYLQIRSVLDVGSGTGRAIAYIKGRRPDIVLEGIEPVAELREVAYRQGLTGAELKAGDASALDFPAGAFDLVCAFGVLHHVRDSGAVLEEMLRVAGKAIFVSDCNNFAIGSLGKRSLKQVLNGLRLWKVADFLKTRGRRYTFSDGDGVAYSYSVFSDYRRIRDRCRAVHVFNTTNAGVNPYRTASHVALLGLKRA
jgi:SAM-dependent methyltransferase